MAAVSAYAGFIFDYGGVLVHQQSDADQARLAETAGVPKHVFNDLYWAERADYDRDAISYSEYWERLASRAGKRLSQSTVQELVELDTQSWMQFDELMWQWVDELRAAGKRVAMLSNMPRELGEKLKSQTGKLNSFDQVTLSYEVRAIKPDPAIYEHCLDGLGVAPDQTLFLDDRIANVQAAEVLGMRAIQFTSRDDVLLLLRT